jgi:two-component system sensor histidine kinase MtrB
MPPRSPAPAVGARGGEVDTGAVPEHSVAPPAPESVSDGLHGRARRLADLVLAGVRRSRRTWRQSLQLRVVTTTVLLGVLTVGLLGAYLYSEIARGLTEQKVTTSTYDARALTRVAQARWESTTSRTVGDLNIAAGDILAGLKPSDPDPTRYVIMARSVDNTNATVLATVESGSLGLSAVHSELKRAVADHPTTQQVQVTDVIIEGERVPAVMVGSQVQVPSAGAYDLYFIYPMQREQATMAFIQNAFLIAGLILAVLVGAVAWVVTRQVVTPVRRAAAVAERLSSGKLNERMASHGEDDLALLATSFNGMADSLQRQIRQLEGLSRVQQRFVSDVSHELRTPLTTIRMAVDLIHESREDFSPSVARSAELLQGELDRFESLLADLLEISRFDAGAAALDLESVDLRSTLTKVVQAARPLADRRGSEIVLDLSDLPCEAEVDERRVERILRNLVVNGIEHGEGRPVEVSVRAAEGAVAIVVADHGVGLRPGEASLVFNRFWRADPARARTTGGTGLGLAIALEDARLHNGWLQAWGQPGEGSRFRLTLPSTADGAILTSPLPLDPAEVAG